MSSPPAHECIIRWWFRGNRHMMRKARNDRVLDNRITAWGTGAFVCGTLVGFGAFFYLALWSTMNTGFRQLYLGAVVVGCVIFLAVLAVLYIVVRKRMRFLTEYHLPVEDRKQLCPLWFSGARERVIREYGLILPANQ